MHKRRLHEKTIMQEDMAREGFQLIMLKLHKAAEQLNEEYDRCTFANEAGIAKALKIQATREVILDHIPKLIESILNIDIMEEKNKWSFSTWIKEVFARLR